MFEERTTICGCDANPIIKVENVPAFVCEVCGEKTFTSSVLRIIERVKEGDIAFRYTTCKVYNFEDAQSGKEQPKSSTRLLGFSNAELITSAATWISPPSLGFGVSSGQLSDDEEILAAVV